MLSSLVFFPIFTHFTTPPKIPSSPMYSPCPSLLLLTATCHASSPQIRRKLKHETLASPPPPQGLPPSVALRHYHRRLVVRASSSFKNRSFFLELGASVPGLHLLRRALRHHRLCLVVVLEVPNPPIAASSSSSASLSLLFICSAA
ncbi:hypothetical protein S245_066320, partial [Arachis hypogaea]